MLGTLTGDLDALTRFGEAVGELGGQSAMRALAVDLGNEALKLVAQGFSRQQDPYGIPWSAKRYPDGRKVLDGATHKLAKSFSIRSVGAWGVVIGSNLERSRFQQAGTGIYGPTRSRIRPKSGKALRFKSASGATLFRRSVKGQQQRRLVPTKTVQSPIWNRALKKRAVVFYNGLLARSGGKVTKIAA